MEIRLTVRTDVDFHDHPQRISAPDITLDGTDPGATQTHTMTLISTAEERTDSFAAKRGQCTIILTEAGAREIGWRRIISTTGAGMVVEADIIENRSIWMDGDGRRRLYWVKGGRGHER
jgi:hypothetical protein